MLALTPILIASFVLVVAGVPINDTGFDFEALELFWSYNRSDPVYPSPQAVGLGEWASAYSKARQWVSQLTNEEKELLTSGVVPENGCSGYIPGLDTIDFPGICLQDAGNGVRGADFVNAYPAGLHVGASWNKKLARQRAEYMGAEFRRKGVSIALGPVVGPIGKIAEGGRNWEGFGADPYLAGVFGSVSIEGLQEHVIACVKHFIANEQETMRNPSHHNQSLSANPDDKTMHELYLWPFQDAVKAGVGSVMSSYNRVNNSYASQNSKILNGLLKEELAFQGFVISDWDGQHSGLASWEAGLDMAMPSSDWYGNITIGIDNGTFPQERLDDMATRILASWYRYADNNSTGQGIPLLLLDPHEIVDARDPNSKTTIFQGAVEGHVLVKNKNALPLSEPKYVSVFGFDAVAADLNTYSKELGVFWSFFGGNSLNFENGTAFSMSNGGNLLTDMNPYMKSQGAAYNGTLFCGGGSGSNSPAYIDSPLDAIARQAYADGTYLSWDVSSKDPNVNPASEVCLVFVNEFATEFWDRPHLRDSYSDELIENVATQCANTIVVIHNAGVRLVDQWYDHENITAIIYAHLPGQDSGRSLVELLYGKQSPSGRLPYTVAKNESDYGDLLHPIYPQDEAPFYAQDNETHGVYIDYKHFIRENIEPRFPFGFGLTYTEFSYSDLRIDSFNVCTSHVENPTIIEGGVAELWDIIARVRVTVTNTGNVAAAEVPQLYIGIPCGPEKVLRGFDKELIQPGQSNQFTFDLTRRDLSTWSVEDQQWVLQAGSYNVYVGKDVLDIQLEGVITIDN